MQAVLSAAGGLGIFLLAMAMMTDGLKVFGGPQLRHLLGRWTSHPLKALLTGIMVTGLVQSSSAVTVATIGFVNAGILSLGQSLGVIFGANIGTTMTGWLVSLIGFGFKIEALALPLIATGVALRIAAPSKRAKGLGDALAGFGLFFLGLAILKEALAGTADSLGTLTLATTGSGGILLFLGIGILATVLTQSSSAAIALILTAASQSAIGMGVAAAAIIGANVGTTSTALLAVLNATPNARRVAAGHIVFNVLTGVIALLILPLLLWLVERVGQLIGQSGHPAAVLALFHTIFNVLGAAIMLPMTGMLTRQLERAFRTAEEDLSRPRHLDTTVAATPTLAIDALHEELLRMHGIVRVSALLACKDQGRQADVIARRSEAIRQLGASVRNFAVTVRMEGMTRDVAELMPDQLRISRYLEEAAELLPAAEVVSEEAARMAVGHVRDDIGALLRTAHDCLTACVVRTDGDAKPPLETGQRFEAAYQVAKAGLLRSAATHRLPIERVDRLLDAASDTRRMIEQLVKATQMLQRAEVRTASTSSETPAASEPPHAVPISSDRQQSP